MSAPRLFISRLVVTSLGLFALSLSGCSGNAACSEFCDRTLVCSTQDGCALKDEGGAHDACSDACSDGIATMDAATRDAVEACMKCISADTSDCGGAPKQCEAVCDTSTVAKGGDALEAKFEALEGDARFACVNGDNAFGGGVCDGGGTSDGMTESCTSSCSNGSAKAGADCSGALGGMVSCQCIEGIAKGRTFSLSGCEALFSANIWSECNTPSNE
jgi:hypothetical protein